MDLKTNQASKEEGEAAGDFLRSFFPRYLAGRFRLIERESIGSILGELKTDTALGKDSGQAARVGKALGAQMMVVGSLAKVGRRYYLSVQAIDVETAQIRAAGSEEAASFKNVKKAAGRLAKKLAKKINAP